MVQCEIRPARSALQNNLALGLGRVAMVLALQGERREALPVFERGRAIIVQFRELSPDNADLLRDLAWFDSLPPVRAALP